MLLKAVFTFVLGTLLLTASPAHSAVWQETNAWTPEWEQKYSDWVRDTFNEDIFTSGNYKGIPTDCADAVYSARIIFAYENQLPFIIKDSTGGNNRLSNQMSRFDGFTEGLQRVHKFMNFVGDVTSTRTLPNDTYPVAVKRAYIRPGTIWTRPRITRENIWNRVVGGTVKEDPGHAELVKDVTVTGVVHLIGSTVPKDVRKMISSSSLVFMPVETTTGFRNWKLPDDYSKSSRSLPGYSLEQFHELGKVKFGKRRLDNWSDAVQSRLALRSESRGENIARQVDNICNLANARVDIIQKSEARRQKLGGACMGAGDYDSYSTPSRDKRIKTTLKQIVDTAGGKGLTAAQRAKPLKRYLDKCPKIEIAPGRHLSLYDFSILILKGDVSTNPNDTFAARWGLESSSSKCPKYE